MLAVRLLLPPPVGLLGRLPPDAATRGSTHRDTNKGVGDIVT
jgi:hypothetical protein